MRAGVGVSDEESGEGTEKRGMNCSHPVVMETQWFGIARL